MESKPHWVAYDWFKLIAAILLLILFIILLLRPIQTVSVNTATLPAVEHPDLPADVLSGLPAGAVFQQNADGAWVILDQAGRPLYTWDAQAGAWLPVAPPISGALTEKLPAGYATVQGVNGGWMIVGADGMVLYIWDVAAGAWGTAGPQIPVDLAARLPEGAWRVQKANGRWAIQDGAGKDLYTWDAQVTAWVQVVPEFLPSPTLKVPGSTPTLPILSPEPTGMPVP